MSQDARIRTSLDRAPVLRDDPGRAWRAGQDAWRRQGIVVVHPDEIEKRLGWGPAQQARNLGEMLFGKRKG